ncbi:unnamed protein product [Effrenium voratum]|nr:unnamed protein product [Effrenium voratum]
MSTGKPENVTPGAPPKKWARHLLVLLGIVLLVFVFDSLVFGSVPLSLKQFQWSACDLVISFLLGACALQAYLLKRKSPEARTEKEEKENGNGKPPAKTMSNINRELDRVSQQGAKQVEAVLRKFEGVPGALDALSYNLVIRAHAKEGNHKRAGEWIMRMEERGIKATVLWHFLRDIDPWSLDAWRLFASMGAQRANQQVYDFKSRLRGLLSATPWREVEDMAMQHSRLCARSMLRIEVFQQFCLWHLATSQGKMVVELEPEELTECEMSHLAEVYRATAANRDFLAYQLLPSLRQVVCLGRGVARQGMAMLRQALKLRSSWALRIFVLSDAEGWADWQQAVEELRTEVSLEGVSFEAVHFERSPQFQAYLTKYPAECVFQNAVERAMLARVLCHELLPNDISHVISMDLGDVLILEDLWHLWVLQEESSSTSLLQASLAGALHHVNAGVVLYHTARMREANFTDLSLQAAHAAFEQGKQHAASLECPRDQAILNQLRLGSWKGPVPLYSAEG